MSKKPENFGTDKETGSDLAVIARRYPSLLGGGVLLADGSFRPGHLEQVLREWQANPDYCERVRADELAYIREAMPEVLR